MFYWLSFDKIILDFVFFIFISHNEFSKSSYNIILSPILYSISIQCWIIYTTCVWKNIPLFKTTIKIIAYNGTLRLQAFIFRTGRSSIPCSLNNVRSMHKSFFFNQIQNKGGSVFDPILLFDRINFFFIILFES